MYLPTALMKIIQQLILFIVNLGVVKEQADADKQRVRNTNILASIPFIVYLSFIVWGILAKFSFGLYLGASILIFQSTGLYFNYKQKYTTAKIIIYFGCGIVLFGAFNISNVDYSIICYAFPVLISFEMIFDVKKELSALITSFSIIIISILACFILPKYAIGQLIIAPQFLKPLMAINYAFSVSLCVIFILLIFQSHTKAQNALMEAVSIAEKANKAKSDFLSNISHELRTPLNGIIGTYNLLLLEDDKLQQKKYQNVLQHTTDHLLQLINHILDFNKIKSGKLNLDSNVFNLKHLLTKLVNVYSENQKNEPVQFIFDIDQALDVQITSDDLRLRQILHNLLSNAFKFTKQGKVQFSATLKKIQQNKLTILFTIIDTGIGIAPNEQNHIFKSFEQADSSTTRKFGGTGLGLSICKELIELFGATLTLQSELQRGSTFSFEITVVKTAEIDLVKETKQMNDVSLKNLTILVAEDNKVNMMVLLSFLKKWQVTVDSVENGELAISSFRKNSYDLILMDLEMPVMDGYTAIKEIRKLNKSIPVIAFTAAIYDSMGADLQAKGFNGYLHKPFNPLDLFNKLQIYQTNEA